MDVTEETLWLKQFAEKASKRQCAVCGRFVAGLACDEAIHQARLAHVSVAFSGGYPDAEREQICFYPEGDEPQFSLVWVCIRWNGRFAKMEHRALLGSLMALGIDRSYFGDLVIGEEEAYLATIPIIAERLPTEWTQAGRIPIRVSLAEDGITIKAPAGQMHTGTVPSLRLDVILAEGMHLSRAKAAEHIKAGLVQVNHTDTVRTDKTIQENDVVSVRGFGRVVLRSVMPPTRKDRLPVTLEIFSKHT